MPIIASILLLKIENSSGLNSMDNYYNGLRFNTFTNILTPALSTLHKEGEIATAYIDNVYIHGHTFEQCLAKVIRAIKLFTMSGHYASSKISFYPSQVIKMLGIILNSKDMIVSPTLHRTKRWHSCSLFNPSTAQNIFP